jgi:hypothetical protein
VLWEPPSEYEVGGAVGGCPSEVRPNVASQPQRQAASKQAVMTREVKSTTMRCGAKGSSTEPMLSPETVK